MNRSKLQQILEVLDPKRGTSVDFSQFDQDIAQFKSALTEKIQARTIDDVYNQLEKFKKKLDFKSMLEAIDNLETTLDQKIKRVTGLVDGEVRTLKKLLTQTETVSSDRIASVASSIDVLNQELSNLNTQKNTELAELRMKIGKLDEFSVQTEKTFEEIKKSLESGDKEVKGFTTALEKIRQEFNHRLSGIGGGQANRQILIGGVDPLTRYTDINWKAGSNVTITYANNDTTKKVDITIAATGGGGGTIRSINSISGNTTAGSTAGTDYVYLCSGTLILTLPTAVANTNQYTVKNVGTGVVTINTTSSQTIDGALTQVMPVQFTSIDAISDTANWNIT